MKLDDDDIEALKKLKAAVLLYVVVVFAIIASAFFVGLAWRVLVWSASGG